jgi:hypothetical protein
MATKKKATKPGTKKVAPPATDTFSFTRINYLTLFVGLVVIISGYIFLRLGSITLAPFLLVLGYCVIIPIGILLRPKKQPKAQKQNVQKPLNKPRT